MSPLYTETLYPAKSPQPSVLAPSTWWGRLRSQLSGHTEAALSVLDADSEYIAERVAPRENGSIAAAVWPERRVRTGIVVGSVQSGKTANLLAVVAKVLDRGTGLVIVLGGTRVSLWLQTYERLLRTLDGSTSETAYRRDKVRVLVPSPNDVLQPDIRLDARRYLLAHARRICESVANRTPVLIVVPKEDDHLTELARLLRQSISDKALIARGVPLEMAVFDDEADDGSILSARDPDQVLPELICSLWSRPQAEEGKTFDARLLATYVAYTATPMANFLQAAHNPLSPTDFSAALRVPAESGDVETRTPSFREPSGLPKYYTGGALFYDKWVGSQSLCVAQEYPVRETGESDSDFRARVDVHTRDVMRDSLRAYLVAGAIRLICSGRTLAGIDPDASLPEEKWQAIRPPTHSMLVHPSVRVEDHFETCRQIYRACSDDHCESVLAGDVVPTRLDVDGLRAQIASDDAAWRKWLKEYQETFYRISSLPHADGQGIMELDWARVRSVLLEEVIPNVRLRVLNSDDASSARPCFEATGCPDEPRSVRPPSDIYSIFIAGNVLSRGLTLEGLSTSVFIRPAKAPVADTQMQMQRWFGYRGSMLHLCRVFLYGDQLERFREYHANDEMLKLSIQQRMAPGSGLTSKDGYLILQGKDFRATAKVTDVDQIPLNPGPYPFVRLVEHSNKDITRSNLDLMARWLADREWADVVVNGDRKGIIANVPLELLEVASLLDGLRYSVHAPDPESPLYRRWREFESTWKLPPLLHCPPSAIHRTHVDPAGCPYSLAAYLRLWSALLDRSDPTGFVPTDRPKTRWHMLNHEEYRATRPRFYLGVRFGDGGSANDERLAKRGVRMMARGVTDSLLDATWGSRGTKGNYFGDQFFDFHHHQGGNKPLLHGGSGWRPRGQPGLVLLHPIREEGGPHDMVAVGLALPHGGPDHFAALRGAAGGK